MVNWLTRKTWQKLFKACYELSLGRAISLDVGGSLWVAKEEVGRGPYGNSKHYTEPVQQVIVTQKFQKTIYSKGLRSRYEENVADLVCIRLR